MTHQRTAAYATMIPDTAASGLDTRCRPLVMAGAFSILTSIFALLLLAYLRGGLQTPWMIGLVSVGIVLAVIHIPIAAYHVLKPKLSLWTFLSIASIVVILLPLGALVLGSWMLVLLTATGLVAAANNTLELLRSERLNWLSLLLSTLVSAAIANYFVARLHLVYGPEMALLGGLLPDWYFHVSMSEMIRNYLAVSNGFHGLTIDIYHFGSHAWLASLGTPQSGGSIHAYSLGLATAAFPILLYSLFFAATSVVDGRYSDPVRSTALGLLSIVGVLFVSDMVGWRSYYNSPSQVLAVIAFMLAFALLREVSREQSAVAFIAACALIPVIAFTKISAGALWSAGVCLAVFNFRLSRRIFLSAIPIGLLALCYLGSVSYTYSGLTPAHFFVSHGSLASLSTLAPAVLAGILYALCLMVPAARGVQTRFKSFHNVNGLSLILAAAGLAPGLLLHIDGGSAWYFMNVSQWVGTVLVAAYVMALTSLLDTRSAFIGRALVVLFAIVVVALASTKGTLQDHFRPARSLITATPGIATPMKGPLSSLFADRNAVASGLQVRMARAHYVELVANIRSAPPHTVVFAPPDAAWFWRGPGDCTIKSFIVPALGNHPMILGLPPIAESCPTPSQDYYAPFAHSRQIADAELCEMASQLKFRFVQVLGPAGPSDVRRISCGSRSL